MSFLLLLFESLRDFVFRISFNLNWLFCDIFSNVDLFLGSWWNFLRGTCAFRRWVYKWIFWLFLNSEFLSSNFGFLCHEWAGIQNINRFNFEYVLSWRLWVLTYLLNERTAWGIFGTTRFTLLLIRRTFIFTLLFCHLLFVDNRILRLDKFIIRIN